ncbi:hypothetical protein NHJ6243_002715 [Beauveria neobassiana]
MTVEEKQDKGKTPASHQETSNTDEQATASQKTSSDISGKIAAAFASTLKPPKRFFKLTKRSHAERHQDEGVKVFVTATVGQDRKGTVISNYTRPPAQLPHEFNYRPYDQEPMDVQTAARITSTMPSYFEEVHRGVSDKYTDGSLSNFSNPALAALHEFQRIWPQIESRTPDILVSIGAGLGGNWGQWATHWSEDSKRLLKAMNTDEGWATDMQTQQKINGHIYWRLNSTARDGLPNSCDLNALNSGEIAAFIKTHLASLDAMIKSVARKLFATTFYFYAAEAVAEKDD